VQFNIIVLIVFAYLCLLVGFSGLIGYLDWYYQIRIIPGSDHSVFAGKTGSMTPIFLLGFSALGVYLLKHK